MESVAIVSKHKKCMDLLSTSGQRAHIPFQMLATFDKGRHGVTAYNKLLGTIEEILKRNVEVESKLKEYVGQTKDVQTKSQTLILNVNSLADGSDPSANGHVAERFAKSKDRLKGLLSGLK